jgi:hypothetical protein
VTSKRIPGQRPGGTLIERLESRPAASIGGRERPVRRVAVRGLLAASVALAVLAWTCDQADARRNGAKAKAIADSQKRQPEPVPKGPLQIIISIGDQRISVYGGGVLAARSAVSTGMRGHPTPMGIFTVIQKERWHRSNLYSAAPMPYMQRITWSGVALHAGVLPGYAASHGCVRLTNEFAVRLWRLTKIGVRVIVARDDVAPMEIAHARLFAPTPKPDASATLEAPAEMLKTALAIPTAETGSVINTVDTVGIAGEPLKAPDAAKPEGAVGPEGGIKVLPKPRKVEPVSVFISRKQGKLLVRQGYTPLFESAVTISNPDLPLGTHVFTAMELNADATAMRWTVVSLPRETPAKPELRKPESKKKTSRRETERAIAKPPVEPASIERARAALDRIDIPKEAADRISELLSPQSSLIISDHALSDETDRDTDFIVLVH